MIRTGNNMKIIHCTQKLMKEINKPAISLEDIIPDSTGIGNWYSNIFRFDRRKCLIFTNEQTLYSFFIYGVKKDDLLSISDLFKKYLKMNLNYSGISHSIIDQIVMEHQVIGFCKTNNPGVIASMNHFIQLAEFRMSNEYELLEKEVLIISQQSNITPSRALKYKYPIEVLNELIDKRYSPPVK